MIEHVGEAYRVLKVLLPAGFIWTVLRCMHNRWRKSQEDLLLSTFHNTEGPWQSANGVVGELYLKAALSDAPGYLPQNRWALRHLGSAMFYRIRHFVRRVFLLPNKTKADKILRELCFERKILERAGWDHTDNEFYKLKSSMS